MRLNGHSAGRRDPTKLERLLAQAPTQLTRTLQCFATHAQVTEDTLFAIFFNGVSGQNVNAPIFKCSFTFNIPTF